MFSLQYQDALTSARFEAVLDRNGRLATLTFPPQGPLEGEAEVARIRVTFDQYGAPAGVVRPAADKIVEAPDSAYQDMFN